MENAALDIATVSKVRRYMGVSFQNFILIILSIYFFANALVDTFPSEVAAYPIRLAVYLLFFVTVVSLYGIQIRKFLLGLGIVLVYTLIHYYYFSRTGEFQYIYLFYVKNFISMVGSFLSSYLLIYAFVIYFKNNSIEFISKIAIVYVIFYLFHLIYMVLTKQLYDSDDGRYSALSVEPSHFGLILGCLFCILGQRLTWLRLGAQTIIFILFFGFVRAKFAIIILPVAFVFYFLNRTFIKPGNFFVILILILMVFVQSFVTLIFNYNDFGGLVTFVTRFSFWYMGVEHLITHPLGDGGAILSTLYDNLYTFISDAKRAGLNTYELEIYLTDPDSFKPKDTFSTWLIYFGLPGLTVFLYYTRKWLNMAIGRGLWLWSLVCFFIASELVYINLTASGCSFQLLVLGYIIVQLKTSKNEKNIYR